jgi:hypothetical protein
MTTFFTTHPGKTKMKITAIQISVNYSHGICSPIAIAGFIHIIPYLFQFFKVAFNALVI